MNIAAALDEPDMRTASLTIAGEAAICDPRGALFFPGESLLVVSDLGSHHRLAHPVRWFRGCVARQIDCS